MRSACLCGALDCVACRGSAAETPCPDCGAAIDAEGYCSDCGLDTIEIHPQRCRCDECEADRPAADDD